jgi:hypothetical protein
MSSSFFSDFPRPPDLKKTTPNRTIGTPAPIPIIVVVPEDELELPPLLGGVAVVLPTTGTGVIVGLGVGVTEGLNDTLTEGLGVTVTEGLRVTVIV